MIVPGPPEAHSLSNNPCGPAWLRPRSSIAQRVGRPSISVITPCLNAHATIERALASVAEQGYEPLEHVVIDGGSTDGTLDLLAAHPGLVVRSGPDRGLSHAMNKGIELAQGEVVGWLNADDFYLPGALELVG